MIRLRHISAGYRHKTILKDVSADLPSGKLIALLGRNGSGKSTLIKAFTPQGTLTSGEIEIDGKDISRLSQAELAKMVSFVTTERIRISNMECHDLVALGRAPYTDWIGRLKENDEEAVAQALQSVGMSAYAHRSMDSLSDGECQRIMIARALAQDTSVMILDEPTAFLDVPGRYQTTALLQKLAKTQQKTIIFSTHDLDVAMELADQCILLDPPDFHFMSTEDMRKSGLAEKIFKIKNR